MTHFSNGKSFFCHIFKYCKTLPQIVCLASHAVILFTPIGLAESIDQKTTPSNSNPPKQDLSQTAPTTPITPATIPEGDRTLPVGLNVNGKNVLPSMNVRGKEDGEKAVDFDRWLVPFDEVIDTLKFKIKEDANGQIEISAPLFKFQLPANKLVKDPQLGRSITVKDLNTIPGITAKFDINKYAIDLVVPSLDRDSNTAIVDQPIVLDGLPANRPVGWGLGAIQQRVSVSGQNGTGGTAQGELKAVGNIFDANWYLRVDQPQFDQSKSWNINDAVIIRQRRQNDLVLGSQLPFWRRQSNQTGTYWGGTTIWREGFTPPVQLFGSDFSINERLQSSRVGRSIFGQAAPGTLVQLIRGAQLQVLKEILVDSSGVYRFDNVIVGNGIDNTFGQDYRVLLYPNGQLTANPEIRTAQFVTTPGQLPTGASAVVLSAGGNRIASGNFGNFDAAQGGILYRRGIDETLTVGVGGAFDREVLGVGEIFWQPNKVPLQVAFSATTGKQWDILGRLDYRPSTEFFFTANTDQFSSRADANWRLSNTFTALSTYDSRRGTSIGGQYSANNSRYNSTYVRAELDNRARLRFGANQRLDNWQLSHQSNESATTTQVAYNLSSNLDNIDSGNQLVASYQTNSQTTTTTSNTSPSFTSLVWRYRAPDRTADGRSRLQTELGYGFNNSGSGIVAGLDLNFIPGIGLRGSYRGASENGRDSYSIELNTTLLTSIGIQGTDARIDDLRAVGQVELTAFIDTNSNGRRDRGEKSYYDPLLFKINQKPLKQFQVANGNDSATIKLPPDSYRLDIDPAGYPVNYRSSIDALRMDIAAGNITPIAIPLVPAYVYTGVVQDKSGKPISGAKVEAISIKNGTKISSITNEAGVYYLEGLEQGEYRLNVSGLPTTIDRLKITSISQPTQELNLTVAIPAENTPPPASAPPAASPPAPTSLPASPVSKPAASPPAPASVPASPVSKPTAPVATPTSSRLVLPLIYMSKNF
jgi:Carboxypeptidase regulatory-like domain